MDNNNNIRGMDKDVQRQTERHGNLLETEHDLQVWKREPNARIRESRSAVQSKDMGIQINNEMKKIPLHSPHTCIHTQ